MHRRLIRVSALAALLLSPLASAHTGHGAASGFSAGFVHPFGGLDHLLAMFAVGLWAAQAGGRSLWLVPIAFMTAMVAGAVAGAGGLSIPALELGIAGSVVLFGLLVALRARLRPAAGAMLVSAFAVFHGFAHGAEMPTAVGALAYGGGFVLATALLHGVGMAAALLPNSAMAERLVRGGGALIAGAGLLLLGTA